MFSRFKTLKELLEAKNLSGHDAVAQRAAKLLPKAFELQARAVDMGHLGAYEDCKEVIAYATIALGLLDNEHHYAFLDVQELPVDVRVTYAMNVAHGLKREANDADELVTHAEQAYESIDALVPTPSVTMTVRGQRHVFVARGANAQALIAQMAPVANSNERRGLRPV